MKEGEIMRMAKRLLTFFSAVLIIVMILPLPTLAADDDLRYGRTVLSKMNNSQGLLYVYDRLVEGIANAQTEIQVKKSGKTIVWDEMSAVFSAVHSDYPEYFWLSGSYSGTCQSTDQVVISVLPQYTMTGSKLSSAKAALEKKISELTKGLSGKSEYEKSLILHDRVAAAVDYDRSDNDQNAYGALVEGVAVCAGYSKAYQLLLHEVGIPAWCVMGYSNNPATNNPESHEWNLVSIDNKWYYTDVTWDDQGDSVFYAYLNVTTKQINEDHVATDFTDYLPNATATAANYFVKNSLSFTGFNADSLANILKTNNNTARVYITGNLNTFRTDFANNVSSVINKMGAPAGSKYSYSMQSLGREFVISVNIIEPNHKHKTTLVSKKAATCTAQGNNEYYTCSCGKWFEDSAATKEITNKDSVVIAAVAHSASGWKSSSNEHWKICTKCSAEISNSKATHSDADINGKCDVCGTAVVVAGSGASSQTGNSSSTATSSTSSAQQSSSSGASEPVGSTDDSSSAVSDPPTESTANSKASDTGAEASGNSDKSNKEKDGKSVLPWAIPAACGVVLAGGGAGVVIFMKRR